MKLRTLVPVLVGLFAVGWQPLAVAAPPPAKPTSLDLVGRWDGTIDFGAMKFHMVLRATRSEDGKQVKTTLDIPDQGARDLPVGALLFHPPDVRIELDAFRTAFVGKVSADRMTMDGQFTEGPGGRPTPVVFRKDPKGDVPAEKPVYTLAAGERQDYRGYWRAMVPNGAGGESLIGLKSGRLSDGTFQVTLDDFEHASLGVLAGMVGITNGVASISWPMQRILFEGRLNPTGDELGGSWRQGGKPVSVTFRRQAKPVTPFPEGTSFTPDVGVVTDVRGDWKGTLMPGNEKIRLVFTVGRLPDASLGATLRSLDQGNQALLANRVVFTNSVLNVQCPAIRGAFLGSLNETGTALEGNWEQGGAKLPLTLTRAMAPEVIRESKPVSSPKSSSTGGRP